MHKIYVIEFVDNDIYIIQFNQSYLGILIFLILHLNLEENMSLAYTLFFHKNNELFAEPRHS